MSRRKRGDNLRRMQNTRRAAEPRNNARKAERPGPERSINNCRSTIKETRIKTDLQLPWNSRFQAPCTRVKGRVQARGEHKARKKLTRPKRVKVL